MRLYRPRIFPYNLSKAGNFTDCLSLARNAVKKPPTAAAVFSVEYLPAAFHLSIVKLLPDKTVSIYCFALSLLLRNFISASASDFALFVSPHIHALDQLLTIPFSLNIGDLIFNDHCSNRNC